MREIDKIQEDWEYVAKGMNPESELIQAQNRLWGDVPTMLVQFRRIKDKNKVIDKLKDALERIRTYEIGQTPYPVYSPIWNMADDALVCLEYQDDKIGYELDDKLTDAQISNETLYKENADLRNQLAKARKQEKIYYSRYDEELTRGGNLERLLNSLESDNSGLRTQLAEQAHQVKLLNGIVTGMRYQVIVARNSVLLDVEQAVQAMYPKYGGETLDAVCTAILGLKEKGDNDG